MRVLEQIQTGHAHWSDWEVVARLFPHPQNPQRQYFQGDGKWRALSAGGWMEWIKLIPAQRPQVAGQLPTAKLPEMRRPRVTALLTPEAVDRAGWLARRPGLLC